MEKTVTKEFDFYGDKLLGVKDNNGDVWLGIRQTCYGIGLSQEHTNRQVRNIKTSLLFGGNHGKFATVQNEGGRMVKREVVCLHEKFVPLWLAQISITPKMQKEHPQAVEKLLKYQLEVAEVLHKTFYGTEDQKSTFHQSLGLEGEIVELKDRVEDLDSTLKEQSSLLEKVMQNSTISTIQQGKLLKAAKDRVNLLLGGAHSARYKEESRKYFVNLWNDFKATFDCGSYKDLNPIYFTEAKDFVETWDYDY